MTSRNLHRGACALAVLGVALAVALGTVLRLVDPLSSPVIPAEDPYTHMALVREHLRDGNLDPLNEPGALYPPGLHSFLAAVWVYTGLDLPEIFRIGPVVFGAIGIVGIALLLARNEGLLAAFIGALALAVAPEAIFRSTMMSPTAMDLAVLPFLFYAVLEMLRGRLAWAGVAGPMLAFLTIAHPWVLPIVLAGLFLAGVLTIAFPWRTSNVPPLSLRGLLAALALACAAFGMAVTGCGGQCGPAYDGLVDLPGEAKVQSYAPLVFFAAVAPAALLLVPKARFDALDARVARGRRPVWLRLACSLVLAGALALVTWQAAQGGFPEYVGLPRMLGWPVLTLAALAFVALPFATGPATNLGAGIAIISYPFVVFNPLNSPFWPHRTAVFLGVGLFILAGVAASAIVRLVVAAWSRLHERKKAPTATPAAASHAHKPLASRHVMAFAVPLLVGVFLGGSVYAATPDAYPGGWYRLYHPCELEALEEVADLVAADPDLVVVTGAWQPKLVVASLSTDASRVWYKPDFFTNPQEREDLVAIFAKEGRTIVVVMDRHLKIEHPDAQTGFAQGEPWQPVGAWCANMGVQEARMTAYTTGPTAAEVDA